MMRKLKIDWDELTMAFETGSLEMRFFLDLETGKIAMITSDVSPYLEDPPAYGLPDWILGSIEEARQVEEGYGTRYISIPEQDSHEGYRDMESFIATVRNERLQDRLWRAIEGRGAFCYFKDVLAEYPAERERWFAFEERRVLERINDWLKFNEIEPTNPVELPEIPEPEEPSGEATLLEDLTLLVIYLSSWEEGLGGGRSVRRAWKGYLFEILDKLSEGGLIAQARRGKSLALTEGGIQRAREIREHYGL